MLRIYDRQPYMTKTNWTALIQPNTIAVRATVTNGGHHLIKTVSDFANTADTLQRPYDTAHRIPY